MLGIHTIHTISPYLFSTTKRTGSRKGGGVGGEGIVKNKIGQIVCIVCISMPSPMRRGLRVDGVRWRARFQGPQTDPVPAAGE